MRKAFTMLEIVFVLVITGLVAVAGSMAIVQIMQNYAIQKEYAKMELDGTSAILQISKYLQDSVWDSIAIKNGNSYTGIVNVIKETDGKIDATKQLVFIAKNKDVLNGYFDNYQGTSSNFPLFSGFIDLSNSNDTSLITAFSNDKLSQLKQNNILSQNNNAGVSIYFPFVNKEGDVINKYYNANETQRTALFKINAVNSDTNMTLSHNPAKIGDIAIIVNSNPYTLYKDNDGSLKLITDNTNNAQIISQGVSSLSVWAEEQSGLLRVRICFENKTMKDFMPEFCKEGVIMQ